jgi:hypothetical protein
MMSVGRELALGREKGGNKAVEMTRILQSKKMKKIHVINSTAIF